MVRNSQGAGREATRSSTAKAWLAAQVLGLGVSTPWAAVAATWQETMVVVVPMGERDTRVRAREAAVEEMRSRASRKVGAIVESSLRIEGNKLSEELKTVGVSLVQIQDLRDQAKVDAQGGMSLEVTARVLVDESELDRRAAAMRSDGEKVARIRQLNDENARLRLSLESVGKALSQNSPGRDATDLLRRHTEIVDALRVNSERVGNTFAPGSLLTLASKDAESWERVQAEMGTDLFDQLMANPVRVNIENVEQAGNGFKAMVRVGWDANLPVATKVLAKYFHGTTTRRRDENTISIPRYVGLGAPKTGVSQRLFDYLARHQLLIVLGMGDQTVELPVLYSGSGFFDACEQSAKYNAQAPSVDGKELCIASQAYGSNKLVYHDGRRDQNPFGILLTRAQAQSATQLGATWVLKRPDGTSVRRPASVVGPSGRVSNGEKI